MDDLISRSALLKSLVYCKGLGRKSLEAVLKTIDEQPTAYDVDKVVEQIGNIAEPIRPVGWSRKIEVVESKVAIDIVKAGGIDE